ncbi:hypothetical protein K501DRAFT_330172 [Backusella circina FSU 941]|nr:hypothetical protein K501DRAFT_330172 [Backusella circina FSU 941]
MSDSQLQASQPQTVAKAKAEEYELVRGLITNHGNTFMTVVTYCACLIAFPILTFFLTLHEVYEGDFDQARFAALKMAALVTVLYGLGYILNRKYNQPDAAGEKESKKDQ